jgi:TonB family protein
MRSQITLEKATSLSFAGHLVFFLLAAILTSNNHSKDINVYTVQIMSPSVLTETGSQPAETKTSANRQKLPPPKVVPDKDSNWLSDEPAAVKVSKKAIAAKKAVMARARHSREIQRMREAQHYKDEKIEELKQRSKLEAIRKKASSIGASEGRGQSEAERNREMAEYGERIQAIIYSNWIYTLVEEDNDLVTKIAITVVRDGTIIIHKVIEPSGNRAFDLSALKAIRKTKKVEAPPFGRNEEIELNFYPDK